MSKLNLLILPLGKAFKKQIKKIEHKRRKQIKAIQYQKHVKTIKKYDYLDGDSPLISKQKEIFDDLVDKRLDKITELDEKVSHNELVYIYKGKTSDEKLVNMIML